MPAARERQVQALHAWMHVSMNQSRNVKALCHSLAGMKVLRAVLEGVGGKGGAPHIIVPDREDGPS